MHSLHLIHRDVKLENIFIGAGGELKLGDFGLTMSTLQESAISPVGTTEYMAPEVAPPARSAPNFDSASATNEPQFLLPKVELLFASENIS